VNEFRFRHYGELDGLRGLAVLLVVLGHLLLFSREGPSDLAALGVLLFFVLSGFLITGVLLNDKSARGRISLSNFYLRRVLRLAPALLIFLAVAAVLIFRRAIVDVPSYELIACVLYMRNIFGRSSSLGHLWSLSLEEQFYALWPCFVSRLSTRPLLFTAAAVTCGVAIARMVAIQGGWFDYNAAIVYMRPWFRFDSIMIGCCLCIATTDDVWRERARILVAAIGPALAWLALLAWTAVAERIFPTVFLTVQTMLCVVVLGQLILCPTPVLSLIFTNALLRHLGRISYGLYLWQQLFIANPHSHWGVLQVFPINVVVSLTIAELSYWLVEVRFLKLKDSFAERSAPASALRPRSDLIRCLTHVRDRER